MKIVDWADKQGQHRNSRGSESAEKARKVNIYKERENSINKHEIEWKQNQENIYTRKTLKSDMAMLWKCIIIDSKIPTNNLV